jgi:hypothetical protein
MPDGGQPWKTAIAAAMAASRRFPTAAHRPWKTLLRFPHSHRAKGLFFLLNTKRKDLGSASLPSPPFRLIFQ